MARILGLDYGERRLGFALSDPTETIAMPLRVVTVRSQSEAVREVAKVCGETGAASILVGMPLSMNGTAGPAVTNVQEFIRALALAIKIPIHTWDERLSSKLVERTLIDADMSRAKRKKVIDKLAAQVVLQSYLDSRHKTANDLLDM